MDFTIPENIKTLLADIDGFIEREIVPLQAEDDNERFFDHRRRMGAHRFRAGRPCRARIGGAAARDAPARRRGRLPAPRPAGGVRRPQHRQPRHGDHPRASGGQGARPAQRPAERELRRRQFPAGADDARLRHRGAEEDHPARHARRHGAPRLRPHRAQARLRRDLEWKPAPSGTAMAGASTARRCGTPACMSRPTTWCSAAPAAPTATRGLTCLIVPMDAQGVKIEEYLWTFNMPTDHARVSFTNVWVPDGAVFGPVDNGLVLARHFVHENRIRRPPPASARRSIASTRASTTPIRASPSASRSAATRRSSGRWSSSTPRPRWCAG